MAKLTEAQCRRICEALDILPDSGACLTYIASNLSSDKLHPPAAIKRHYDGVPAWQRVQRAASEGDGND